MKTSTTLTASLALTGVLVSILGCANWGDASEGACVRGVFDDGPPIWLPDHGSHEIFVGERNWDAAYDDACRIDSRFVTEIRQIGGDGSLEAARSGETWTLFGERAGWVDLEVVTVRGPNLELSVEVYSGLEARYQWADDHQSEHASDYRGDFTVDTRKQGFALIAGQSAYLDIVHDRPGNPYSIQANALPEFDGAPWTAASLRTRENEYPRNPLESYRLDVDDAPGSYVVTTSGRPEDTLRFDVVDASEIARVEMCDGLDECVESGGHIPRGWHTGFADDITFRLVLYTADGKVIYGELPEEIRVSTPSEWTRERRGDRHVQTHGRRVYEYGLGTGDEQGAVTFTIMGEPHSFLINDPGYWDDWDERNGWND